MMVGTSGSPLGMILCIVNLYLALDASPHASSSTKRALSSYRPVAWKLPTTGLQWSAALATPAQQTASATRIAGLNEVIGLLQTRELHA